LGALIALIDTREGNPLSRQEQLRHEVSEPSWEEARREPHRERWLSHNVIAETPADVPAWRKVQRVRLLEARQAIPLEVFQAGSIAIMRAAADVLAPPGAGLIGCYWPFRREPDCLPYMRDVLRAGGRVALPVVVGRGQPLEFRLWNERTKMAAGVWGILHPAEGPPVVPTALIVPLLGFDDAGYRLGYGAGYYDMTLASHSPRPFTVGVGFESSCLPTIYPQPHDMPLDVIVTESGKRVFEQN
jgi:5,10-methenyltetrahydrofolate synthetase